ncbi:transmembrane protein 192-like [Actinia tenebrosa]|uniref:Transmembrane protein 192 n=1 Tax=Actinia tenebrosa TaxID=6105 RepID=A0A6P8HC36_ACTTE|nr:transmembrane protein 192-like [Actinia tenebrosa]
MVSLSIEQGQGGYFFDRQESMPVSNNSVNINEDLSHEVSSIHAELVTVSKFRRLQTAWVAVLLIILFIGYAIATFLLKRGTMHWLGDEFPPFGFFLILHVLLWLIVFVADRYLQHAHHVSQGFGYLQMFRDTKNIRRLPYNVFSLGNAVLLVIVAVLGHKYSWTGLNLIIILQIVFILEVVLCLPGIIWYLVKVIKFNKAKPQPDAEDKDVIDGFSTTVEAGFRDGEYVNEVLEKQADMIRYLQQHNANLGRRLMQLMQQQQLDGRLSASQETRT